MLKQAFIEHRWRAVACALLCAAAAAINIFLLDYLHSVAQQAEAKALGEWLPTYAVGVLLLFGFSLASNLLLVTLACRMVAGLRGSLVRRMLGMPYLQLEHAGKGSLLANLTEDVANMSEGLVTAPQFVFNSLTVALCLGYLVYLSPVAAAWFFGVLLVGGTLTALLSQRGNLYYEHYRALKDRYYAHLHALFDGAKELALVAPRRRHFLEREILPSIAGLQSAELKREVYWNIGENWTRLFLLAGLGVAVVATRSAAGASPALTMSYFIVITFIAGPVDSVIHSFSAMAKALVSARAVTKLGSREAHPDRDIDIALPTDWRQLCFDAVSYTAPGNGHDEAFHFGPVSLDIRRGEVLFVTGGNGSGKSTFGKLLVGLYQRDGGEIRLDDLVIGSAHEQAYKGLFSTVFSDHYLFPCLLDPQGEPVDCASVAAHLHRLGLADKVSIEQGYLSTTALSQGQRKRLALLQSWLQDAQIYLFDEWAADQDPHFRAEFYRTVLPEMKRRGKTVIVISHDDRYFSTADRICKFEVGRLVELCTPAAAPLANQSANAAAVHSRDAELPLRIA
jgi:cyclic peptide transporter